MKIFFCIIITLYFSITSKADIVIPGKSEWIGTALGTIYLKCVGKEGECLRIYKTKEQSSQARVSNIDNSKLDLIFDIESYSTRSYKIDNLETTEVSLKILK